MPHPPSPPGPAKLVWLLFASLLLAAAVLVYHPPAPTNNLAASIRRLPPAHPPTHTRVHGHGDFSDGRQTTAPQPFLEPQSAALGWVNVMLGNAGPEPNLSGGMIPAVAPPFGMTRWTAQTRKNYVSMCPYNQTDDKIHGFIATHQPAIWMGESGPVEISAGLGDVITHFESRGMAFHKKDEYASANYYENVLRGDHGDVAVGITASSHVGHIRYTFAPDTPTAKPYIAMHSSRDTFLVHGDKPDARQAYRPNGYVRIRPGSRQVEGWGEERQDKVLVGKDLPAAGFKGYYVARFSRPFETWGVARDGVVDVGVEQAEGEVLSGWVGFAGGEEEVEVRVGVSFISIEQARLNIDLEIPDGQRLHETSFHTRSAWADKLDRLVVSGATPENLTVLYTAFAHTLVYPSELSEPAPSGPDEPPARYYSGYTDSLHAGTSYTAFSLWDTFRAQHPWLLLLAPERVPRMLASLVADYRQGGWMPMWKNVVESNVMVGSHADAVVAGAMVAGVTGFAWGGAWEGVEKGAFVPPDRDTELAYSDRQEDTPQEARAGLTEYMRNGWVAADLHSEAGSRTLDYAYDDHAASIVASHAGAPQPIIDHLAARSKNYKHLWNAATGFMQARTEDGAWMDEGEGWTEGDQWAYTLDVMHDVPGLIELMGGKKEFVRFLDRHFDGGHNLHTNEPSHHIPYLYSLAGAPSKSQSTIRSLARSEYNHTASGLAGNEDCGQMSAWYLFTALGLYPVDPAAGTYVLGAPLFDKLLLRLPAQAEGEGMEQGKGERVIEVVAAGAGARGKVYVGEVRKDGEVWDGWEVGHAEVVRGGKWVWTMEDEPQ